MSSIIFYLINAIWENKCVCTSGMSRVSWLLADTELDEAWFPFTNAIPTKFNRFTVSEDCVTRALAFELLWPMFPTHGIVLWLPSREQLIWTQQCYLTWPPPSCHLRWMTGSKWTTISVLSTMLGLYGFKSQHSFPHLVLSSCSSS